MPEGTEPERWPENGVYGEGVGPSKGLSKDGVVDVKRSLRTSRDGVATAFMIDGGRNRVWNLARRKLMVL